MQFPIKIASFVLITVVLLFFIAVSLHFKEFAIVSFKITGRTSSILQVKDKDMKLVKKSQSSRSIIKREFNISGTYGEVVLQWDPDDVLESRKFSTDTMKQDFFTFLEVWNRRPLKSNPGGMGLQHQFMLWYSVRRIQPKLIVESGMKSGATTWLLHEAAPTAKIISFEPVIQKDWVSNTILATVTH